MHLQLKRWEVSRKTCRVSAPLLPDFDKTLVNHLSESHVRLPPWRFFSHIPRLLSFGAALKAVFGDAIRKAGGPSAFALTPRQEEPRSPLKARVPTRCTPLPEGMFGMCSADHIRVIEADPCPCSAAESKISLKARYLPRSNNAAPCKVHRRSRTRDIRRNTRSMLCPAMFRAANDKASRNRIRAMRDIPN